MPELKAGLRVLIIAVIVLLLSPEPNPHSVEQQDP